ncbi:hypothetical protein CLV68_5242 [Actinokineospora cianjurensis]|uniref:Uncharacterized protein n=1 Tax=Actinokineospora cianjurensis TaxID=585224 RepID=A0A421AYB2_9PSEU|nr:hypothetical protein CLV68_5242 [Actinokineospora cianjurensis]
MSGNASVSVSDRRPCKFPAGRDVQATACSPGATSPGTALGPSGDQTRTAQVVSADHHGDTPGRCATCRTLRVCDDRSSTCVQPPDPRGQTAPQFAARVRPSEAGEGDIRRSGDAVVLEFIARLRQLEFLALPMAGSDGRVTGTHLHRFHARGVYVDVVQIGDDGRASAVRVRNSPQATPFASAGAELWRASGRVDVVVNGFLEKCYSDDMQQTGSHFIGALEAVEPALRGVSSG